MTFVDASAIVAILTREPEADALVNMLDEAQKAITSPVAVFEATLGICRKRHVSVEEAAEDIREFLDLARHQDGAAAGGRAVRQGSWPVAADIIFGQALRDEPRAQTLRVGAQFGAGKGLPVQQLLEAARPRGIEIDAAPVEDQRQRR